METTGRLVTRKKTASGILGNIPFVLRLKGALWSEVPTFSITSVRRRGFVVCVFVVRAESGHYFESPKIGSESISPGTAKIRHFWKVANIFLSGSR